MSKFKSYFIDGKKNKTLIKECDNKNNAIDACIKYDCNYCLDNEEVRREALRKRNFCMCGCGPNCLLIEEEK